MQIWGKTKVQCLVRNTHSRIYYARARVKGKLQWKPLCPAHDPGFDNYSSVFARPPVRWYLVHSINGDFASVRTARFAIRRTAPFPRRAEVGAILSDWEARFRRDGAIMQIIGFDPVTWEIIDLANGPVLCLRQLGRGALLIILFQTQK